MKSNKFKEILLFLSFLLNLNNVKGSLNQLFIHFLYLIIFFVVMGGYEQKRLLEYLFKDYDHLERPVSNFLIQ
jgi:hypothetical protein